LQKLGLHKIANPYLNTENPAFNVFNTPQFDLPNAAIGAGNAGRITSIVGTPRQIQFGVKVVF
jgi:hypothetical protein